MMKIFTITILCFSSLLSFQNASAQCTIDDSHTTTGIYPSGSSVVCEGKAYDESVTFAVENEYEFNGFVFDVDSVIINSINNLPPGLDYECLNGECKVINNPDADISFSCIRLFGKPTTAGVYNLEINFTAYAFGASKDDKTSVDFTVNNANSAQCSAVGINDRKSEAQFQLYPSPANNKVYFDKNLSNVSVFDITGQLLLSTDKANELNVSSLKNGIYLLQSDQGTRRLIID